MERWPLARHSEHDRAQAGAHQVKRTRADRPQLVAPSSLLPQGALRHCMTTNGSLAIRHLTSRSFLEVIRGPGRGMGLGGTACRCPGEPGANPMGPGRTALATCPVSASIGCPMTDGELGTPSGATLQDAYLGGLWCQGCSSRMFKRHTPAWETKRSRSKSLAKVHAMFCTSMVWGAMSITTSPIPRHGSGSPGWRHSAVYFL